MIKSTSNQNKKFQYFTIDYIDLFKRNMGETMVAIVASFQVERSDR